MLDLNTALAVKLVYFRFEYHMAMYWTHMHYLHATGDVRAEGYCTLPHRTHAHMHHLPCTS